MVFGRHVCGRHGGADVGDRERPGCGRRTGHRGRDLAARTRDRRARPPDGPDPDSHAAYAPAASAASIAWRVSWARASRRSWCRRSSVAIRNAPTSPAASAATSSAVRPDVERRVLERHLVGEQAAGRGGRRLAVGGPDDDGEVAGKRDPHRPAARDGDDAAEQRRGHVVEVALELACGPEDRRAGRAQRSVAAARTRRRARRRAPRPRSRGRARRETGPGPRSDRRRRLRGTRGPRDGSPAPARRRRRSPRGARRARARPRRTPNRGSRTTPGPARPSRRATRIRARPSRQTGTKQCRIAQYRLVVRRHCARPGCSAPATATFTFDTRDLTVWLDTPAEGGARAGRTVRAARARALTPPQGWHLEDRRGARARAAEQLEATLDAHSPMLARAFQNAGAV